MANLSIRKLDDATYAKLRILASEHAISMEEEARRILSRAVDAPIEISHVFEEYFGKINGVDLSILNQRSPHEPTDFS